MEFLKDIVSSLVAEDDTFDVIAPERTNVEWIEANYPIASYGRIDWNEVPGHRCITWNDFQESIDGFRHICTEQELGNPSIRIVFSNALRPSLRMNLGVALKHVAMIFAEDFDTWVICEDEGWCIEYFHEGETCFGRAPDV